MAHLTSYTVEIDRGHGDRVLADYTRKGLPIDHVDQLPVISSFMERDVYLLWVPVAQDYDGLVLDLYVPNVRIAEGGISFLYNAFGPPLAPPYALSLLLQRFPIQVRQRLGLANVSVARQSYVAPVANLNLAQKLFGATGLSLGNVSSGEAFDQAGGLDAILDTIGARDAWRYNQGEHVTIAVIDSGIDGSVIPEANRAGGYAPGGDPWSDQVGHGSMVGRIALAVAPKAKLLSIKPQPDDSGLLSSGNIFLAADWLLAWALEQRRDHPESHIVVNNSWGVLSCQESLLPGDSLATRLMNRVDRAGVAMMVWSAGNSRHICGDNAITVYVLASMVPSLAVGSLDQQLRPQFYSGRGPGVIFPWQPAVVAPTYGILPWGAGYRDFGAQGGATSSCAPMVSGALAILMTESPHPPHRLHRAAIRAGADNVQLGRPPGTLYDVFTGSGLLRIDRAVAAMNSGAAKLHPTYQLETLPWTTQ